MTILRPNLAAKLKKGETYDQKLPGLDWDTGFLASPKLDGIRVFVSGGNLSTRSGKPVANKRVREKILDNADLLEGFDGELVYGNHEDPEYSFFKTSSAVMSQGGPEDVDFHVFDDMSASVLDKPYRQRIQSYGSRVHGLLPWVYAVEQVPCYSMEQMMRYEETMLARNYEGIMIRGINSRYKQGRSTFKEEGLIAIKRFEDDEGIIVGFEELERNENEAYTDELGYTKRSSHQSGKVAAGILGKLVVEGVSESAFAGRQIKVGTGFTAAMRKDIWENRDNYLGRMITFKYQNHSIIDLPRIASFKGFRDDL